ncbi:FtsX-like permease family protein [Streptomyces sudanensis]|uniref:ABC transporter permease n=1 Tax=Streptomyces sudanensis TaxID=436397 RepID=UPI0020CF4028|nr:FtsX-like permease family protein [Streptomyces sudanensis]MCP9986089.1 FtsX-like permease family protein [Streptomyces sudanensis]
MLEIAWKTLRARKAAFLGAFVALFCGTAVLAASGILVESGMRTSVRPERYAGAAVMVGGNQTLRIPGGDFTVQETLPERARLKADTVRAVAGVPGVERAVGDYSFAVVLGGPGARPLSGHGWDSAALGPFRLTEGKAPASATDVVLDSATAEAAGVRTGDRVRVVVEAVPAEYRVSGVAEPAGGAALERRGAVFFADATAARLSGHPGSFDAVGVLAEDGADADDLADRVEDGVPGTVVYTGNDRSMLEFPDIGSSSGLLMLVATSFGGMAAFVAMFVVAGTLGLSVNQRRREFAVLRAIGSTPRQVYKLVLSEALLVAVVAGVLGCVPGVAVAELLRGLFAGFGAIPHDLPLVIGPAPMVAALVLGVGTALLAGLIAAYRPARINPVDALGEAAVERRGLPVWRVLLGLFLFGIGTLAALMPLVMRSELGAAGAGGAALLGLVGLALLGPLVVRAMVAVIGLPLRASRVSGFLAASNSLTSARRLSSAVMPLVLAIGFSVTLVYTQTTLSAVSGRQVAEGLGADYVVGDGGSGGLAPQVVDRIRGVKDVEVATAVSTSKGFMSVTVFEDKEIAGFSLRGVTPEKLSRTIDLGIVDGDIGDLRGRTLAMEDSQATLLGTSVGERVPLYLGDGTLVELKLVATYERGIGFGEMTVPQEVLAGHTTARSPGQLLVRVRDGGDREAVGAELRKLAGSHPSLSVQDRSGFSAGVREEATTAAWVNLTGLALILAYIAIAVVNTLVVATAARSREFALMRLIGMTRRQVVRTLRWEALLMCAIAVLLGTAMTLLPLGALSVAFLGRPLPAGSPLIYVSVVGATVVLGIVATMLPVRLALRAKPVEAIGVRE